MREGVEKKTNHNIQMNIIEQFIKESNAEKVMMVDMPKWIRFFADYLTANGYEIVKKEECRLEGCTKKGIKHDICELPETPFKKECKQYGCRIFGCPFEHDETPGKKECEACKSCVPTNTNCPCIHTCTPETPTLPKGLSEELAEHCIVEYNKNKNPFALKKRLIAIVDSLLKAKK